MNRRRDELAPPGLSAGALTDRVSATVLGTRPPRAWWLALGLFVITTAAGMAVEFLLPDPVAGGAVLCAG